MRNRASGIKLCADVCPEQLRKHACMLHHVDVWDLHRQLTTNSSSAVNLSQAGSALRISTHVPCLTGRAFSQNRTRT